MNRASYLYIAKILTGIVIVYFLSRYINYTDFIWCIISVILVTSPEGKDALNLVIDRIKANLIGASAGVLMLWLHPPLIFILCGSALITIIVCTLLRLENPMRAALAAAIIVTLHEDAIHFWSVAVERILSVLAGCIIALLVTFLFHRRIKSDASLPKNISEA